MKVTVDMTAQDIAVIVDVLTTEKYRLEGEYKKAQEEWKRAESAYDAYVYNGTPSPYGESEMGRLTDTKSTIQKELDDVKSALGVWVL